MNEVTPQVYLINRGPDLDYEEMRRYLSDISKPGLNAVDWLDQIDESNLTPTEVLAEFAGRGCYNSFVPGLNPNVERVRPAGDPSYLGNILNSGHGSVVEHPTTTWVFNNVSRVFTHELCRHRAGVAISQESLRYVRLTELDVWVPEELEAVRESFVSMVEALEEWQVGAAEATGITDDKVPFGVKKAVTSALRRLAPIGLSTRMTWSANHRTLRHVIAMRTSAHAEAEIREVFDAVARTAKVTWPVLYQDMERNAAGEWVFENEKI